MAFLGGMSGTIGRLNIILKAVDEASGTFRKVKTEVAGLSGRIKELQPQLVALGATFTAMGGAGIYTINKLTGAAAELEGLRRAFDRLRRGSRLSLEELEKAAAGTVSQIELIRSANTAMMLGIDPTFLPRMMEVARRAAIAMGTTTTFMFDSIAKGVGRQSKLILDNLGIVFNAKEAYEEYAASIGKSASELTESERRQAYLIKTLQVAQEQYKRMGDVTGGAIENYQRFRAAISNLKVELGAVLLPTVEKIVGVFSALINTVRRLPQPLRNLIGNLFLAGTAFASITGPLLLTLSLIPHLSTSLTLLAAKLGSVAAAEALATGGALSFSAALKALWASLGPVGWAILAVSTLATVIVSLAPAFMQASRAGSEFDRLLQRRNRLLAEQNRLLELAQIKVGDYGEALEDQIGEIESQLPSLDEYAEAIVKSGVSWDEARAKLEKAGFSAEQIAEIYERVTEVAVKSANQISAGAGDVVSNLKEVMDAVDKLVETGLTMEEVVKVLETWGRSQAEIDAALKQFSRDVEGATRAFKSLREAGLSIEEVVEALKTVGYTMAEIQVAARNLGIDLSQVGKGLAETLEPSIENVKMLIRRGLVGDAQNLFQRFTECVGDKNLRMAQNIEDTIERVAATMDEQVSMLLAHGRIKQARETRQYYLDMINQLRALQAEIFNVTASGTEKTVDVYRKSADQTVKIAKEMNDKLVGRSIYPDMMRALLTETREGLSRIAREWGKFADVPETVLQTVTVPLEWGKLSPLVLPKLEPLTYEAQFTYRLVPARWEPPEFGPLTIPLEWGKLPIPEIPEVQSVEVLLELGTFKAPDIPAIKVPVEWGSLPALEPGVAPVPYGGGAGELRTTGPIEINIKIDKPQISSQMDVEDVARRISLKIADSLVNTGILLGR